MKCPRYFSYRYSTEQLEQRITLSSVSSTGTLLITGSDAPEVIDVRFDNTNVRVTVNSTSESMPRSVVRRIAISSLGGNDFVINRTNLLSTLNGGDGDDTLIGGSTDDTIVGGLGTNVVDGRDGAALIDHSESGQGIFAFSSQVAGDDTRIRWSSPRTSTRVDLIELREGMRLLASDGDDTIRGSGGAAVTIDGGVGDDTFTGFQDTITPSGDPAPFTGMPTFVGGDGDDYFDFDKDVNPARIIGGAGDDTVRDFVGISAEYGMIDLGAGRDLQISTGDLTGPATVFMGPGVEALQSTRGTREVFGNSLSNTIEVISGSETGGIPIVSVYGGQGDDVITDGGNGTMYAHGSDGNDSIAGFGGDDTLRGGAGNDTLVGGAGKDKLYGDAGDDLLLGRGGSKDRLDGGDGTDSATADVGPSVIDLVLNVEDVN